MLAGRASSMFARCLLDRVLARYTLDHDETDTHFDLLWILQRIHTFSQ